MRSEIKHGVFGRSILRMQVLETTWLRMVERDRGSPPSGRPLFRNLGAAFYRMRRSTPFDDGSVFFSDSKSLHVKQTISGRGRGETLFRSSIANIGTLSEKLSLDSTYRYVCRLTISQRKTMYVPVCGRGFSYQTFPSGPIIPIGGLLQRART